jgi:hypothetical protein
MCIAARPTSNIAGSRARAEQAEDGSGYFNPHLPKAEAEAGGARVSSPMVDVVWDVAVEVRGLAGERGSYGHTKVLQMAYVCSEPTCGADRWEDGLDARQTAGVYTVRAARDSTAALRGNAMALLSRSIVSTSWRATEHNNACAAASHCGDGGEGARAGAMFQSQHC